MKSTFYASSAALFFLMLLISAGSIAQTAQDSTHTLPLTVLELSARNQDGLIVVEWTSIDESLLSHYVLQYSADGKEYKDLLKAPSSGRAHDAAFKYTITDYPIEREHHHYRLMAATLEGALEEKGSIRIGRAGSLTTILHPNPAKADRFPSVIPSDRPYMILLCDASGKVVKEYAQKRKSSLLIPIVDLTEGLHLLRIYRQQ